VDTGKVTFTMELLPKIQYFDWLIVELRVIQ